MYFEPWTRTNFDGTLVLGESLYRGPEEGFSGWGPGFDRLLNGDERQWVKCQIEDAAIGMESRFYKKLRAILHPELSPRLCWERTAFTEFVQDVLPNRHAPRDWEKARKALPEIMDFVSPRRVVVVGKATWEHLPDGDVEDVDGVEIWRHERAVPSWIYHPTGAIGRYKQRQAVKVVATLRTLAP